MNRASQPLQQRQQLLLVRSAELRRSFAREAQVLQPPLALADQVLSAWQWLRAHPQVPLAAAAVLVVLRPRRAWRLGWRLWSGWQMWQRVRQRLQPFAGGGGPGGLGGLSGLSGLGGLGTSGRQRPPKNPRR